MLKLPIAFAAMWLLTNGVAEAGADSAGSHNSGSSIALWVSLGVVFFLLIAGAARRRRGKKSGDK